MLATTPYRMYVGLLTQLSLFVLILRITLYLPSNSVSLHCPSRSFPNTHDDEFMQN